jgi:hypothetical protein
VAGFNNATADGLAWGVFGVSQVGEGVHGETNAPNHAAVAGFNNATADGPAWGVFGSTSGGIGVHGVCVNPDPTHPGVGVKGENGNNGTGVEGRSVNGIGVFGSGGRLAGRFEGDVEVTGDIRLVNAADCAEEFDIAGAEKMEPGTVMVLTPEGALQPSQQAYDKKVAGVISGAGDYKPGIVLDKQPSQNTRMPIALLGKVYCKVDAQYAPIEVGDLLTTSPTAGHGMKADDPLKAFGAVIGKALRPLEAGQGLIPILIALQ